MALPSWLVIGIVTLTVAFVGGSLTPVKGKQWFRRLRRPEWLTFERAIPFIWIFIFMCGAASAYLVWDTTPMPMVWLMGMYLLVEIVTVSYTPLMLSLRRLRVGTIIGGIGFILGATLALLVLPISNGAFWLLVPYLIWSPVGTATTWQMEQLNPSEA